MNEEHYLQEGFNAKSLKIPDLRSILNKHDIDYSSNAKKSQLVEIFNDKVAPNADKWLRDYRAKVVNLNDDDIIYVRTEPSTKHVYDFESSDTEDKKDSKSATEEVKDEKSTTKSVKAPTPDRKNVKHSHKNTPDKKIPVATSSKSPVAAQESGQSDSPFTHENVFQSKKRPLEEDEPKPNVKKAKKKKKKKALSEDADIESSVNSSIIATPVKAGSSTPSHILANHTLVSNISKDSSPSVKKSTPAKSNLVIVEDEVHTPSKLSKLTSSKSATPKSAPAKVKATPSKLASSKSTPSKLTPSKQTPSKEAPIKETPSKLTPAKVTSSKVTPSKAASSKSTPSKSTLSKSTNTSSSGANSPRVSKTTPKSSVGTPYKPLKYSEITPSKKTPVKLPIYETIEDEEENFDHQLKKIKGVQTPSKYERNALSDHSNDFLTPRKFNIPSTVSSPRVLRSSNPSTPKKLSLPKSLTPKPRLIPIQNELLESDDDISDDEDSINESSLEIKKTQNADTVIEGKSPSIDANGKYKQKIEPVANLIRNISLKPGLSYLSLAFVAWAVLVTSGLFGYWYREQLDLVGYCGQGIDEPTFYPTESKVLSYIGQYLDNNFKPNCIPCPNHARCFPHLELGCYEDFIEYKPWNNFIVPYNKKCVPDTKKAEKIEIIIDVALDLLRSKNANKQCGQSTDIEEAGVSLSELHDLLLSMKAPYISIEEFEELWERSIVELEKEPDVIVRQV